MKTREAKTELFEIGGVNFKKGKMMKKFLLVSLAFVASTAFAHNCPNEIKAIDAKMTSAKLSDADSAKVKALRDDGEKFHKAGKHDESMKALSEAKKILGI
jgi:hypothetical protein